MPLLPKPEDGPWKTALTQYEGEPLALRVRPNVNTPEARRAFPRLAVIEQELAEVGGNGLPVSKYNLSLLSFDRDVHEFVGRDGDGIVVLVETFSGKRTYYAYVADDARLSARIKELRDKYPQHILNLRHGNDPEWSFYKDYRQQFPW